jgi:Protein of unknown function (DUF3500)
MHSGLAFGIGLAVAVVGGIALWPNPGHAGAAAVPRPVAAAGTAPRAGPPGSEEVLAKAVLALLSDDQRRVAVVDDRVGPDLCVARSVPPTAIVAGRGILLAELPAAAVAVVTRLFEHCAAALPPERAAADLARAVACGPGAVAFAFAGERGLGGPCYVRLHGPHFVVEWLRTAEGRVHGRWRDFAIDAGAPWLRDDLQRAR